MNASAFHPQGLATLIGSLPLDDHGEATRLVLDHTPDIPLWVQLPKHPQEGMLVQFLQGFPGAVKEGDRVFIKTDSTDFETDLLNFYEKYLAIMENPDELAASEFDLTPQNAAGFFELTDYLDKADTLPAAVKGQITGPITLGTGLQDQNKRAIFYDDRLRDAAVKLLALKARWQVRRLARYDRPVILFFDEPALTGFGSSAFISISKEDIAVCFQEVIDAVHAEGGLAGIHVCGNAEWSLVLDSPADIVSFDAYAYFDRLVLFAESLKTFLARNGIIAWGIVPTLSPEDLDKETVESLTAKLASQFQQIEALGIDGNHLFNQSLITPACGTGALSLDQAKRALDLTQAISVNIRDKWLT